MKREFIEGLDFIKQIGSGGFADVYLARGEDGQQFVVKALSKQRVSQASAIQEVFVGQLLEHKNIARHVDHFHDEDNFYLMFEYQPGCDLFNFISEKSYEVFDELEAKIIFAQLVDAIKYCHENEVVHMDVKLENIIYDKETKKAMLIDFGLSQIMHDGSDVMTKRVGTYNYAAPEILKSKTVPYSGTKVDIWALGIVLFALLTSRFPFTDERRNELLKGNNVPLVFLESISFEARELLTRMLEPNPCERATIDEILSHPWMQTKQ